MARPGVTESEVFEAISSLREMGAKVTVESVRAELRRGSPNTINRHLRAWREKPLVILSESPLQIKKLKNQQLQLEAQLQTALEQTERLSLELLERDKKIHQMEKELASEKQNLKEAQLEITHLKSLQQIITEERRQIVDTLVTAQQDQAEQFKEDLKAINQMSLSQVREISMSGQDAWLEEKVKVRELGQEIEKLKLANVVLQQNVLAEQKMNEPLRKRITDQERLIANCLDPKRVEAFRIQSEAKP